MIGVFSARSCFCCSAEPVWDTLSNSITLDGSSQFLTIPDNSQNGLLIRDAGGTPVNYIRFDTRNTNPAGVYLMTQATFALTNTNSSFNNGDMSIQLVNDTTLQFTVKGSDGTVRTATLTLS